MPAIKVEGIRELNRTLNRAADRGIVKAVGRANKKVGRLFIDRWLRPRPKPEAVGRGAGAAVRPSAAKRELKLRVGGRHRAGNVPYRQWGKRPGRDSRQRAPRRPYIIESAQRHRDDIAAEWFKAIREEIGFD